MALPVIGVNELVLEVADLAAAERFYAEELGFPVIGRWEPPQEAVWVLAGMTRIGLWLPQTGIARSQGGKRVHYALLVDDSDYDGVVQHLRGRHHRVDEVHWSGGARSVYVPDPDFNVVEFWTCDVTKGSSGHPQAATAGTFGLVGVPAIAQSAT